MTVNHVNPWFTCSQMGQQMKSAFFKGSKSIQIFLSKSLRKLMELVQINVGDKNTECTIRKVILLNAGHIVDVSTN